MTFVMVGLIIFVAGLGTALGGNFMNTEIDCSKMNDTSLIQSCKNALSYESFPIIASPMIAGLIFIGIGLSRKSEIVKPSNGDVE